MPQSRALWLLKVLLFALLGTMLANRLAALLELLAWLALRQTNATFLTRPFFSLHFYLPFAALSGFLLGLVPLRRLRTLAAASFALFRTSIPPTRELDMTRPILWAWTPFAVILLVRLFTFNNGKDHSVLGSTTYAETRWDHFFALPTAVQPISYFDQILVVAPTLALLAYTFGVWLRHQFPSPTTHHTDPNPT